MNGVIARDGNDVVCWVESGRVLDVANMYVDLSLSRTSPSNFNVLSN